MEADDPDQPWWYRNRQRKVALDDSEIESFLARLSRDLTRDREFAVLVASDEAVRRANKRFRGKAGSTDVLSFPDGEAGRLGDILISARRASTQGREHGHSAADEVKILILHGLLHLLGYDHASDDGRMRETEARLRRRYGLSAGLIERAEAW